VTFPQSRRDFPSVLRQARAHPIKAPVEQAMRNRRAVAAWLVGVAAMIFLMVVIGGVTRLTESGLSITEWKPVTGALPPLTDEAWQREFELYQRIPEAQTVHYGMTLDEFKRIYFWEYLHRLWGRLIGIAFAVPLVWFILGRRLPAGYGFRLGWIFALGALQGAVGWWMVASGLVERTDVSQYRLVAHLGLALVIYAAVVWTILDLLSPDRTGIDPPLSFTPAKAGVHASQGMPAFAGMTRQRDWLRAPDRLRRAASAVGALVFLTILSGGFVAGLDAGLIYNTFPLMDGKLFPSGYFIETPWWLNWFENVTAVQFNHRWLAIGTLAAILALWGRWQEQVAPALRVRLHLLLGAALLQVALGIATLLLVVPIPLAALHQAGAVLVLTAAVVLRHAVRAGSLRTEGAAAPALPRQAAS
jgi:heme a synthase